MNNAEILTRFTDSKFTASFRVIGIGESTKDVIEAVKSFGYDLSATILTEPFDCAPTDEDKMAIIVAKDNEDSANRIAKQFHDAGILTIGLLDNADVDCYDSVATQAEYSEYPGILKAILQPMYTQGVIACDFNDLRATLADSKHFYVKSATRCGKERLKSAICDINSALTSSMPKTYQKILLSLYFNKVGRQPMEMQEMTALTEFAKSLPDNVEIIWSVYPDESIKADEIKITILGAGK
ncbi:MAG: hypothetical protein K2M06_01550 [Muribaculaceae bacterium]|nr:hypothetical protein [Muribaculaceae bacterium]